MASKPTSGLSGQSHPSTTPTQSQDHHTTQIPKPDHPTQTKHHVAHLPTNHYQNAIAAQASAGQSINTVAAPTKDDQKRERHENLLTRAATEQSAGYHSTSH
ncbi:uncharacterized protein RCC_09531 [Ramularia collo-cygni]|uniref:Uncharacterized protein n=1 Tax=Ramularia collo-cygni TaxID=112498 RepID=A0A2D3V0H0_9PEZI|nr:uncharacterized protein RCC_09531 [Ramularia collo-cygni]CZT23817.1 uncharacterized protein RCC_09531 [Ramularia collo-cygni]